MKTSVAFATSFICCLMAGMSSYAWSEDLDSALENISISSEADNAAKKSEVTPTCADKSSGANCLDSRHNDINTNAYESTIIQQSLLSGHEQNVTINGATVTTAPQATVQVNGF